MSYVGEIHLTFVADHKINITKVGENGSWLEVDTLDERFQCTVLRATLALPGDERTDLSRLGL